MLSHTLVFPGIGELTGKMLAAGYHNFYVGKVPEELRENTFGEMRAALRKASGILSIGLLDSESGAQHINPSDEMNVGQAHVVYLATRPVLEVP